MGGYLGRWFSGDSSTGSDTNSVSSDTSYVSCDLEPEVTSLHEDAVAGDITDITNHATPRYLHHVALLYLIIDIIVQTIPITSLPGIYTM